MMTLEEYLQDPCGKLSIPYWKWKHITLPKNMKIQHSESRIPLEEDDDVYFRLKHDLQAVKILPTELAVRRVESSDWPVVADLIAKCYPGISFSADRLAAMTKAPAYAEYLWLIGEWQGKAVGCVLADLDREAGEGILEWVQVLPEYRGRGFARALIMEILARMDADFATVSGQVYNTHCPEKLYRACGFYGKDYWHIIREK